MIMRLREHERRLPLRGVLVDCVDVALASAITCRTVRQLAEMRRVKTGPTWLVQTGKWCVEKVPIRGKVWYPRKELRRWMYGDDSGSGE